DKRAVASLAARLVDHGFTLVATGGTAIFLKRHGLDVDIVKKHYEGEPNILQALLNKEIAMVINTHEGKLSAVDSYEMRRTALVTNTLYFTTIAAAEAAVMGFVALQKGPMQVKPLQEYY
ncbi:MAG TPA: carbamoyl phosphate synthase large subunit, partial [bacterium]|nr:carbamoyl phosphate synthase large subunit [bacterium]